jgi:fused signal recognition particle receptor
MSFFKKLKERMFRSSDKIGEGLEALVAESASARSAALDAGTAGACRA